MDKLSQEIDLLLQEYLDGKLQGEKLEKIKSGLAKSESLRNRLEILKLMQATFKDAGLVEPSVNFTQRVMGNLNRLPAGASLSPKNGLILLMGILVAAGIGLTMLDLGVFNSLNGILALDNMVLPDVIPTPTLPSIAFNGKWIVNAIIALNLGLALLILDRTILRPLFNRRSRIQF